MKTFASILADPALKHINEIKEKVDSLHDLNRLFHTVVAKEYRTHCRVSNLKDRCLVIDVDNASWATRIYHQTPEILKKLQQITLPTPVLLIKCRVNPNF